ncbi:MAG: PqqD family peptide modification chaperone [Bacteroidales bacterium]|nr:PqqD family peptide modification chaperone [Bacteroidales bacterium]
MKFIRQTKDTFIRCYGTIGYITNQLTKHDRNYNETGADFLAKISREPKEIDIIVRELLLLYQEISFEELRRDFIEFVEDLEKNGFVITGDTSEEISAKEPSFSYKLENPKTALYDFTNPDKKDILTDSSEFLYEEFHKEPRIFGLQIEVSSRCNERCIHCYIPNSKKDDGGDMALSLILQVLDEAKEMGTLQVTLSGGELFLHKDIAAILHHARKNDFVISILSNLALLTDKHIALLKEINPSLVQVSLYSMNADEHDAITQVKGSFNKTKNSIERLVAADIPLQISCPVMKLNRKSYKDVLIFANKLRTKAYTDFIMMAQADLSTNNLAQRINLDESKDLLHDMLEFDQDYLDTTLNQEPKSRDIEKFKKMPVCGVGVDNICLTANGDYYPCAGWQGMIVGNAYKESLKSIWENSEQLKQLRTISNGSFPDCVICEARDYCAMCLVRNFNENNGDMFKITKHFCDIAFLNKKMVEDYYVNKQIQQL